MRLTHNLLERLLSGIRRLLEAIRQQEDKQKVKPFPVDPWKKYHEAFVFALVGAITVSNVLIPLVAPKYERFGFSNTEEVKASLTFFVYFPYLFYLMPFLPKLVKLFDYGYLRRARMAMQSLSLAYAYSVVFFFFSLYFYLHYVPLPWSLHQAAAGVILVFFGSPALFLLITYLTLNGYLVDLTTVIFPYLKTNGVKMKLFPIGIAFLYILFFFSLGPIGLATILGIGVLITNITAMLNALLLVFVLQVIWSLCWLRETQINFDRARATQKAKQEIQNTVGDLEAKVASEIIRKLGRYSETFMFEERDLRSALDLSGRVWKEDFDRSTLPYDHSHRLRLKTNFQLEFKSEFMAGSERGQFAWYKTQIRIENVAVKLRYSVYTKEDVEVLSRDYPSVSIRSPSKREEKV